MQGVRQEVLALTAEWERLVQQDCLEKMENLVTWGHRVFKVCQVYKEHLEREERRVHLVETEPMEERGRQDHKA